MSSTPMPSTPDPAEVVVGVDTHKDIHVAAALTTMGVLLGARSFATPPRDTGSCSRVWSGAPRRDRVHRFLPRRRRWPRSLRLTSRTTTPSERRCRDAEVAARAVLSGQATAIAKSADGQVEVMRMFKLAKASAIKSRGPGDQPAQGRPDPRRSRLALLEDRAGQPGAVPLLCRAGAPRPHRPDQRRSLHAQAPRSAHPGADRGGRRAHHPDHPGGRDPRAQPATPLRGRTRHRGGTAAPRRRQPASAPKRPSPPSAGSVRPKHRQARHTAAGSTAAVIDKPTRRSTRSPSPASAGTPAPRTTSADVSPKGRPVVKRSAASLDEYGRAGQVGLFVGNGGGRPRCLATRWPV